MGFEDAGGRSVKIRQRQRTEQLETFCLLLLRDGDGGEKGLFGLKRICRIVLP